MPQAQNETGARERTVLSLVHQARQKADAFLVVGFLPGGRFFYDCDDRISIPDLHGLLQNHVDAICASVSRARQDKRKEVSQ